MTEEEANQQEMDDMRSVDWMLKTAKAAGMSVEVVLSFANYVKTGSDIQNAAACAVYDWDC